MMSPHRVHLGGIGLVHYANGIYPVVQKPDSIEASSKGWQNWRWGRDVAEEVGMVSDRPKPQAVYSSENIAVAYQFDWSLTVFWRKPPWTDDWFEPLQQATEPDGIRLLKHRFSDPQISLFLVSTKPDVPPISVPQRVKGRLQYLLRDRVRQPFQRNFDLRSIGSTTREKLESYLGSQLEHHPEEDRTIHWTLADLQVIQPDLDLSQPRFTSHGRFSANLHLVIVNDWRWRETCRSQIESVRDMLIRSATRKQHLLKRIAILPDHIHLMFGIAVHEAPLSVALSYMNNVAYVYGMQPVLKPSCFIGTSANTISEQSDNTPHRVHLGGIGLVHYASGIPPP